MRQFYRFRQLGPFVGSVSKGTIYRWIAAGKFPPPTKIGDNVCAWSDDTLEAWQRGIVGTADGTVSKKSAAPKKKKGRPLNASVGA